MKIVILILFYSLIYSYVKSILYKSYRINVYLYSEVNGARIRNRHPFIQFFQYLFLITLLNLAYNLIYTILTFYYIYLMLFKKYDKSFKTCIKETYLTIFKREKIINSDLLDQF